MALFGGGQTDQQQRYYPRPVDEVFKAVIEAGKSRGYTLRSSDDLSMSAEITTPVSAFTWGEKLTATCIPSGEGTVVTISATGKVGAQFMQSSKNAKVVNQLFELITGTLRDG